jgi:hypothetical protein
MALLDLRSSPTVLSNVNTHALSKPSTGPSDARWLVTLSFSLPTAQRAFGGPGGSRTHVQNLFYSPSYSNFILVILQSLILE